MDWIWTKGMMLTIRVHFKLKVRLMLTLVGCLVGLDSGLNYAFRSNQNRNRMLTLAMVLFPKSPRLLLSFTHNCHFDSISAVDFVRCGSSSQVITKLQIQPFAKEVQEYRSPPKRQIARMIQEWRLITNILQSVFIDSYVSHCVSYRVRRLCLKLMADSGLFALADGLLEAEVSIPFKNTEYLDADELDNQIWVAPAEEVE